MQAVKNLLNKFIGDEYRMSVNPNQPAESAITPEVQAVPAQELAGRTPANMNDTLAALPGHIKDFVEKAIADKQNALAMAKQRETEAKLSADRLATLENERQAAEQKRLEEQGNYKALYEQEAVKRQQLETAIQERLVKEAVARELARAGAIDDDLTEVVLNKYKDVIRYQDGEVFHAAEVVSNYKAAKPGLFKPEAPAPVAQAAPAAPAATGLTFPNPAAGTPSSFDARTADSKSVAEEWAKQLARIKERK